MTLHPNLKKLNTILALFFLSIISVSMANAGVMTLPKKATVSDAVKISISNPENKTLELVVSSRSLKDPLIFSVPDSGEVILKDLSEGHYILGLREVGVKKYIEMSSLEITGVHK